MKFDKQLVIARLRAGWSVNELAESFDIGVGALRNYMSSSNIKVREIRTQVLREKVRNGL